MTNDNNLKLSSNELSSIDQFRRLKETSVLVIIFTDIKGFTELTERKGELHSNAIRHAHDDIIVGLIEKDGDGKVIKHIGDAVMAVFSEPSTAVAKALEIQAAIAQFNREHDELDDLLVRMGMHMGQVSVENSTQLDLFGRHVNRAARVEGMADGGQIFMTYSVFDSAKGWLQGKNISWVHHGKYFMKGIKEPQDIYEVYDQELTLPKPPQKAKKKRNLPALWVGALLIAIGIAIPFVMMQLKSTEVWFVDWYPQKTIIDQKDTLVLGGTRSEDARKSMTAIPAGRHLAQYNVNQFLNYYMEFDVKRGKNYIHPEFVESYLPDLYKRLEFNKGEDKFEETRDYQYLLYDANNQRVDNQERIWHAVVLERSEKNNNLIKVNYNWKITRNDKVISEDKLSTLVDLSSDEKIKQTTLLYKDDMHFYYLRSYIHKYAVEVEIAAAYKSYFKNIIKE